MGLLVTLYLITSNVYNSVEAPLKRGFSFIEMWGIGVQVPILFAIIEYGFILSILKYGNPNGDHDKKADIKKLIDKVDMLSFFGSGGFIIVFNLIYWSVALG